MLPGDCPRALRFEYGKQFRALCSDCDEGLHTIAEQFKGSK